MPRTAGIAGPEQPSPCARAIRLTEAKMMFLDYRAYLNQDGAVRCGLPAGVRHRFSMRSTDGPLESAMIRCPVGHRFNEPIESLTWAIEDKRAPGTAGVASGAPRDSRTSGQATAGPGATGR